MQTNTGYNIIKHSAFWNNKHNKHKKNCKFRTLIILDWDDTLFPTSWLVKNSINLSDQNMQNKYLVFFSKLDVILYKLLTNLLKHGKVIIVTNAMKKWVYASSKILPSTHDLIQENIKVISARDLHQHNYPNDNFLWKKLVFKQLSVEYFNNKNNYIQNIVSVGDAEYEYMALISLHDSCLPVTRFLKSIRFLSMPSYDTIIDQLEVLNKSVSKFAKNKKNMDLNFNNLQ